MLVFILLLLLFVFAIVTSFFITVRVITSKLPSGRAIEMLNRSRSKNTRVIACIGDSLTHGKLGASWVDKLRHQFPQDEFLNEGVNGDVVWQVYERSEPILKCRPDIAILMIGSNDTMGSFDKKMGEGYLKNNQLPEIPTFNAYKKLLPELIDRLYEIPKIAICTLPPIGEYPDSEINHHVEKFNDYIRKTAIDKNISILDVSNCMWAELSKRTYPVKKNYSPRMAIIAKDMYGGCIQHYIFKRRWDKVAKSRGQWLLFDQIHLGEKGAQILFNLSKEYIFKN